MLRRIDFYGNHKIELEEMNLPADERGNLYRRYFVNFLRNSRTTVHTEIFTTLEAAHDFMNTYRENKDSEEWRGVFHENEKS